MCKIGLISTLAWHRPALDHHNLSYFLISLIKSYLNSLSLYIQFFFFTMCVCAEGLCASFWGDLCAHE